jgi:hypothetical protein
MLRFIPTLVNLHRRTVSHPEDFGGTSKRMKRVCG